MARLTKKIARSIQKLSRSPRKFEIASTVLLLATVHYLRRPGGALFPFKPTIHEKDE